MADEPFAISRFPVHLGLGARVLPLPEFTGEMSWYERYGADHAADGVEGRLVTLHRFTGSWDTWEMHPKGDELVVCLAGSLSLTQEREGGPVTVKLGPGEAIINPPGVWHTADIETEAQALFITAGVGTEIRPR